MAFRISNYRDSEFNDINGTGIWEIDTTVYCDTVDDLPGIDDIANYRLAMGCKAIIIENGDKYNLNSSGVWNKDESGSGSEITIDSELSDTSENPVQNKVVKAALDGKLNISSLEVMTQAEYDALITKSAPLYFIVEEE